jgi:hypothetical protein
MVTLAPAARSFNPQPMATGNAPFPILPCRGPCLTPPWSVAKMRRSNPGLRQVKGRWVQDMTDDAMTQAIRNDVRQEQYKDHLRRCDQQSLDERARRHLEIDHQGIIAGHSFAAASSECIDLYRDGHFISVVMASQAVNEGIIKLIVDRNRIACSMDQPQPRIKAMLRCLLRRKLQTRHQTKSLRALLEEITDKGILSSTCAEASLRIIGSFRNDVHHMNPKVVAIDFKVLAKRNLQDLAEIEKEIFAVDYDNGKLFPKQPKYWDCEDNGTVPVFLRLGGHSTE